MLPSALALLAADERPRVVHQAGRGARTSTEGRYQQAGVDARVLEFIDDPATALATCDFSSDVVARVRCQNWRHWVSHRC